MKDEIGQCVYVLHYKLWGKTLVGNKLRSRTWWENRLQELINTPTIIIDPQNIFDGGIYDVNGNPLPAPTPFEQEMGWTEDTAEHWYEWLKKAFRRYYERKATS